MKRNTLASTSIAALSAALLLASSGAFAQDLSWPTFRHDQGRTGRSTGTGEIAIPAVKWTYDLGGTLGADQIWVGDLTGDAQKEFAIAQAGRVLLKNAQDEVIWATEAIGANHVIGAWDFDQNGEAELLATADGPPAALIILDSETGESVWRYDGFDTGASGLAARAVLVADFTDDGFLDIACSPYSGDTHTRAFSFASGYSETASNNLIWIYEHQVYSMSIPQIAGDVDNDGNTEIVTLENQQITIIDGISGVAESETDNVLQWHSFGLIQVTNLDTDEQPEIIAIGNRRYDKAITVFDAVDGTVTWQYQWYPTDGKELVYTENSVIDLNGDGDREMVIGVYDDADDEYTTNSSTPADHDGVNTPDQWTLLIFDGATGAVLATLDNAYLVGVDAFDPEDDPYVLVQSAPSGSMVVPDLGTVSAYQLVGSALEQRWSINNTTVSMMPSISSPDRNAYFDFVRVANYDIDSDTIGELLVLQDLDDDDEADVLRAIDPELDTPTVEAELTLSDWEYVRAVGFGGNLSALGTANETAVFSSRGNIEVLDADFALTGSLRIGGFSLSPIAADLDDDGQAEVVAGVSTNELQVLDVSSADQDTPPVKEWGFQGGVSPILTATDVDGDGTLELAVSDYRDPLAPVVALLDETGDQVWETELTGYGRAPAQLVYGKFNSDSISDLLVLIQDATQLATSDLRIIGLSGVDGSVLWNQPTSQNYYVEGPILAFDDGSDEFTDFIVVDANNIEYYSGLDGALIDSVFYLNWSYRCMFADWDNDEDAELLISTRPTTNGLSLYELYATTPTWTVMNSYLDEISRRWVGVSQTGTGLGLIKNNAEGSIEFFDPEGNSIWGPIWLRDGTILTEDPGGANDIQYVTVADIDGDTHEDALVGTADGYLMAIRIDDASLVWSLPLYSQAFEPVVADVDADDLLEVLIATGDGYLHMVDQATLEDIGGVRDVALDDDFALVNPDTDIDITERRVAFGAAWQPVTDATYYSYTLLNADNIPVVPWIDGDSSTEAVIETAPLPLEQIYRLVVVAHGDELESPQAFSDGVLVTDQTPPVIDELTVDPEAFNPDVETTTITAAATDATWIESWTLEIFDGAEVLAVWGEEPFDWQFETVQVWDGTDLLDEAMPDGTYQVRLTVIDAVDHLTFEWATVTLDRLAPDAPVITAPEEDEVVATLTPTFEGTAEAGALVRLYVDDAETCTANTNISGLWSCVAASDLTEADHTAVATAEDAAANLSEDSAPVDFTIDLGTDTDTDTDTDVDTDTDTDADTDTDTDVDTDTDTDADTDTGMPPGNQAAATGGGGCSCQEAGVNKQASLLSIVFAGL